MDNRRKHVPFDTEYFEKKENEGNSFSMADTFGHIYRKNHWKNRESLSGNGSERSQTRTLEQQLPLLFRELGIEVLLDIPCGDFNWMSYVNLSGIRYIGGDIVPEIAERNQRDFGTEQRQFITVDLASDQLPKADLVLCRDCLVHFSFSDIFKTVRNIKRSGVDYLLTTTFPNHTKNEDITTGDWRLLNLELPPFNFPAPGFLLNEDCTEGDLLYKDKSLGLWHIDNIPTK